MKHLRELLDKLDEKAAKVAALRPLDRDLLLQLERTFDQFETEFIATSNQIEGNSLTLQETELVIKKGLTVSGKPMQDHLEAVNQRAALDYIKNIVQEESPISIHKTMKIHAMILCRISDPWAGRFRNVPVRITGSRHVPPNHALVAEEMDRVFEQYNESIRKGEHPIVRASNLHQGMVDVHPFVDGNGRTARLLLNLELMRNGYPLTVIPSATEKRIAYYEALEASRENGSNAFVEFVIEIVDQMLDRYLDIYKECGKPHLYSIQSQAGEESGCEKI